MLFKTFCFNHCIEYERIVAGNGKRSNRSIRNLGCDFNEYYHSNQTINTAKNESTGYTLLILYSLVFYHRAKNDFFKPLEGTKFYIP